MKLTRATDYAFAVLCHLAAADLSMIHSVKTLAATCQVPERFLANIVHGLSQAGILQSRRGKHGGVRLARDGSEITIRQVVEAIEGEIHLVDCQAGGTCARGAECSMRQVWGNVRHAILSAMEAKTLADVSNAPPPETS